MTFKVNRVICQTCIFGTNSPISQARFEELRAIWLAEDIVQECHDATTKGLHRVDKKINTIYLHRVILERKLGRKLLSTEYVDHIDGNPCNNLRSNLRPATKSQNGRNRGKTPINTSGYKGVYWRKDLQKWFSQIKHDGGLLHIGLFSTREEAYKAYCEKAKELHGEFANFG